MLREGACHPDSAEISVVTGTRALEVEALIEHAVTEVVSETPTLEALRTDMVDKLVQALAGSWIH